MKAYVNRPDGGKKALEILEEMNNQYRDGNIKARPDIQALAVAMDACAKSGLTSEAERILDGIDDSKKSEVLFNTIISGYKREGRGHEAETVLRRMISLEKSGWNRCAPDMITYALCIEAVSVFCENPLIPLYNANTDFFSTVLTMSLLTSVGE
jgi:pentatricopeptide repeat protein